MSEIFKDKIKREMINKMISKLHLDRYLNSRLILAMDLAISVAASFLSYLVIKLLFQPSGVGLEFLLIFVSLSLLSSFLMFYVFKTYRMVIRHSTLREVGLICIASFCKSTIILVVMSMLPVVLDKYALYILLLDYLMNISLLILVRVAMVVVYDILRSKIKQQKKTIRVLIYGTCDKSVSLLKRLQNSPHYSVVGFVSYGTERKNQVIENFQVYYFNDEQSLDYFKENLEVGGILFSGEKDAQEEQNRLVHMCTDAGLRVLIAPPIDEVIDGKVMKNSIRDIKIEDLLGRPEIKISMDEIIANFQGKTIMVTGAAGSIGSELCRQLATFGIKKLVLFDNAETPMHNLRLELEERYPDLDFVPVIGDVRLTPRLDFAFRNHMPQVVFHAAAYKHVPLMEENPCEAVMVNVAGSKNVADKCVEYDVEKMVMISTDKAVNPTNIMGCTKRLAEIYVQSLGLALEKGTMQGKTKFVTTRFGNVLGSNGSVIPRFREQIAKGGPITVTHPDIVRFFMTIPEACRLVMEAATMTKGNQIFVFDMGEAVKIKDLATRMIELAGLVPGKDIEIEYTGLRPGEKLYEEVLSNAENTIPTAHERIRIAKVREYDYESANAAADKLYMLGRAVEIPAMVRLMKDVVPEFKSKNSRFEEYDK